jgi:AraC-like DNA-binding protein/DNA-binding transcriptional regulator YdaS (Cro superfamily)
MIHERKLPEGGEWMPQFRGWCFLQVKSGICYWQEPGGAREIPAGSALVLTRATRGGLCASQLSGVEIAFFYLEPEKLTGLLSLREQHSFKTAASAEEGAVRVLGPEHAVAERFKKLCLNYSASNLAARLQLLQLFADLFGTEFEEQPAEGAREVDGRGRLRRLLNQMAASEFVELSLTELAPKMCCSPRHLSRLFRAEVGASFREKQTELRLVKACEMLANSNAKVVEVALTSGYQSNSLFSLLFKKRFGVSPGKWRQQHAQSSPGGRKHARWLSV